jgi:hypothetical protein
MAARNKHKKASGEEEEPRKKEMERNSKGKKSPTETKTIKTGIGKRGMTESAHEKRPITMVEADNRQETAAADSGQRQHIRAANSSNRQQGTGSRDGSSRTRQ